MAAPQVPVVAIERANYGPGGNIPKEDAITFANNLPAFNNWKNKLQTNFGDQLKSINIMDIFPFGPAKSAKAGFVMANATISRPRTNNASKTIQPPGFAFIRGGAVAILPILHNESGDKFVLTTIQPRVPGGESAYEEIPAGMLDAEESFIGVAAKEMKEETTLDVKKEDLFPLSLIYPSIGGCDENIKIFLYQAKMTNIEIEKLQGIATGNLAENETIHLKIRPYDEFKAECMRSSESTLNAPVGISDAKAQVALGMYELMLQLGKIPNPKNVSGSVSAAFNARNPGKAGGKRHTRKHSHRRKHSKMTRHSRK